MSNIEVARAALKKYLEAQAKRQQKLAALTRAAGVAITVVNEYASQNGFGSDRRELVNISVLTTRDSNQKYITLMVMPDGAVRATNVSDWDLQGVNADNFTEAAVAALMGKLEADHIQRLAT